MTSRPRDLLSPATVLGRLIAWSLASPEEEKSVDAADVCGKATVSPYEFRQLRPPQSTFVRLTL
jgi:hypothetical protein